MAIHPQQSHGFGCTNPPGTSPWLSSGSGVSRVPSNCFSFLQIELAESGTKHVQGFICTERRVRLSTVKKWLGRVEPGATGRAHVEAIFEASTPAQAAAYCKDPAKRHPDYSGFLFEKGV